MLQKSWSIRRRIPPEYRCLAKLTIISGCSTTHLWNTPSQNHSYQAMRRLEFSTLLQFPARKFNTSPLKTDHHFSGVTFLFNFSGVHQHLSKELINIHIFWHLGPTKLWSSCWIFQMGTIWTYFSTNINQFQWNEQLNLRNPSFWLGPHRITKNQGGTVDGGNSAPVEVGSLSHYLQGFIIL